MASKRRPLAYLSGGMEHAHDEGAGWRAAIEGWLDEELGHRSINPNTDSERLLRRRGESRSFRASKRVAPEQYWRTVRAIVDHDSRAVVEKCDYVICLWDMAAARGAGTKGELTLARFSRKPAYVVTRIPFERIPGWVIGCTTHFFPDFLQLKTFLRKRYMRKGASHG